MTKDTGKVPKSFDCKWFNR